MSLIACLPYLYVTGQMLIFVTRFHDHQIITTRKDSLGTEILGLPFTREELESILEELMS